MSRPTSARARLLTLGAAAALAVPLLSFIPAAGAAPVAQDSTTSAESSALRPVEGRYLVTLAGTEGASGFTLDGTMTAVRTLLAAAGGTVVSDLSRQIGVLVVESRNVSFADTLQADDRLSMLGTIRAAGARAEARRN